jgi:hypothetical protein
MQMLLTADSSTVFVIGQKCVDLLFVILWSRALPTRHLCHQLTHALQHSSTLIRTPYLLALATSHVTSPCTVLRVFLLVFVTSCLLCCVELSHQFFRVMLSYYITVAAASLPSNYTASNTLVMLQLAKE